MIHTVKFAVVREDPELEVELVRRTGASAALLVASGGCTALTLVDRFPGLRVAAFDLNPSQLAHVQDKVEAVARGDQPRLAELNQRGAFEGLFRVLRRYVEEFVTGPEELAAFFSSADQASRGELVERWVSSRYWPAAFAVTFNEPFLLAMFGPDAVRHAAPGSYPGYFQGVFERGLRRADAHRNPFLQHVLLGSYREGDGPGYLRAGRRLQIEAIQGTLLDIAELGAFDLFSLSNVFDWSDDTLVQAWASALARHARPGSAVLIRQLNNDRDVRHFFEPHFQFDSDLGAAFLERDRSLFYNRFEIGFRRP